MIDIQTLKKNLELILEDNFDDGKALFYSLLELQFKNMENNISKESYEKELIKIYENIFVRSFPIKNSNQSESIKDHLKLVSNLLNETTWWDEKRKQNYCPFCRNVNRRGFSKLRFMIHKNDCLIESAKKLL